MMVRNDKTVPNTIERQSRSSPIEHEERAPRPGHRLLLPGLSQAADDRGARRPRVEASGVSCGYPAAFQAGRHLTNRFLRDSQRPLAAGLDPEKPFCSAAALRR